MRIPGQNTPGDESNVDKGQELVNLDSASDDDECDVHGTTARATLNAHKKRMVNLDSDPGDDAASLVTKTPQGMQARRARGKKADEALMDTNTDSSGDEMPARLT